MHNASTAYTVIYTCNKDDTTQTVTDFHRAVQATIELDPWGGDTNRSWQQQQQPRKYTTYERDAEGGDEAMRRRYNSWWSRFLQPDPYDGSYNLTDPQSLNRYSYVQNDPVNFVDPTGLNLSVTTCSMVAQAFDDNEGGGRYLDLIWQCVTETWETGGTYLPDIGDRGEGRPQNPTPQTPLHCQPDVIKAMEKAWRRTANGALGTEAGFVLNGTPKNYKIVETESANTQGYQKFTINIGGSNPTFALFHVHPNSSGRNPSTPENNKLGNDKGDTGVANERGLLFFVGHRTGLTMYDPKTKQTTDLRKNLDWMKPCK